MQTMTIKEAENVLKEIMNEEDDRFQLLMKRFIEKVFKSSF